MRKILKFIPLFIPILIISIFLKVLTTTTPYDSYSVDYLSTIQNNYSTIAVSTSNDKVLSYINDFLSTRNLAFCSFNVDNLSKFYNNSLLSNYAYLYEVKRINYFGEWSNERSIIFKSIYSDINVNFIETKDNGNILINFTENFNLTYSYLDDGINNSIIFNIPHNLELSKNENSYIIAKDYYEDPFANSLKKYTYKGKNPSIKIGTNQIYNIDNKKSIDTIPKSVKYADKYYLENNKLYPIFFSSKGNSANFVSQCLGDKYEGLGLKMNDTWNVLESSWSESKYFKEYFLSSLRGEVIISGSFKTLYPNLNNINLGDIVSYKKKDKILHTSIVTGFDSKGYPLVNSKSPSTYKAPFDLGWSDDSVQITFIRIKE